MKILMASLGRGTGSGKSNSPWMILLDRRSKGRQTAKLIALYSLGGSWEQSMDIPHPQVDGVFTFPF